MKMNKKIIALIMSALMIMSFIPVSAFADGEEPAVPVKAEWDAHFDLKGVIGTDELTNLETPDLAKFVITYSDGSEKTFVCRQFIYDEGTDDEYMVYAFYDTAYYQPPEDPETQGEEPESSAAGLYVDINEDEGEPVQFVKGWNDAQFRLRVPYIVSGKDTEDEVVEYKELLADVRVICEPRMPLEVEYLPADGFVPNLCIGSNFITTEAFYGEGNAFRVKYREWNEYIHEDEEYTVTYNYTKGIDLDGDEVEGFFGQGRLDHDQFELEGLEADLLQGENELELTYSEYVEALGEEVPVTFKVTVDVQKYDAYAEAPIYAYTGKVIKPKFKVYNSDGDPIDPAEYEYEAPANKKMGWYDVEVKFKDEFKDKYLSSFIASYGIGPKKPVIRKIAGGKKSLTVYWKKLTKSQLKNVDGYYIEIARDKNFTKSYKSYKITGKKLKAGKAVLKKLAKGKKYYVQMYAFKKITQDGTKFSMPSDFTKVKTGKTR